MLNPFDNLPNGQKTGFTNRQDRERRIERPTMKPEDLQIPRECFLYQSGAEQIKSEGGNHYEISSIDFTNDFKTYVKGASFPYEGFVTNENLWATNQAKSIFIESIKLLSRPQFILGTIYTLLFNRNSLAKPFIRLCERTMSPVMLKDKHISIFARELQYFVFEFLRHLITEQRADKISEVFARMIDNDDAYKQRLKDLFSMTTKDKLLKPKELTRLVNLMDKRQHHSSWVKKVKASVLLLRLAIFFIPSARKGYKSAVQNVNLDNLILTWQDLYWSLYRKDYDFAGMTFEERKQMANDRGWTYPSEMV